MTNSQQQPVAYICDVDAEEHGTKEYIGRSHPSEVFEQLDYSNVRALVQMEGDDE